jgi:hypothetical protein
MQIVPVNETQPSQEYDPFAGWNVSTGGQNGSSVASGTGDVVMFNADQGLDTLDDYIRANDMSANVARFTPEQIARYTALSRMAGQEPTQILAQNEAAFQAKQQRRQQLEDQYGELREDARNEVATAREKAAEEERKRDEALRQMLAALYMPGLPQALGV